MTPMRILPALLVAAVAVADSGQGTADKNANAAGLRLGTYWYGARISHADLRGKVVLVEIWGS